MADILDIFKNRELSDEQRIEALKDFSDQEVADSPWDNSPLGLTAKVIHYILHGPVNRMISRYAQDFDLRARDLMRKGRQLLLYGGISRPRNSVIESYKDASGPGSYKKLAYVLLVAPEHSRIRDEMISGLSVIDAVNLHDFLLQESEFTQPDTSDDESDSDSMDDLKMYAELSLGEAIAEKVANYSVVAFVEENGKDALRKVVQFLQYTGGFPFGSALGHDPNRVLGLMYLDEVLDPSDRRKHIIENNLAEFGSQEALGRTKDQLVAMFGTEFYNRYRHYFEDYLLPSDLTVERFHNFVRTCRHLYRTVYHDRKSIKRISLVLRELVSRFRDKLATVPFTEQEIDFLEDLGVKLNVRFENLKLTDAHSFGDRKESLAHLKNLVSNNGGKLDWKEFLAITHLSEADKVHYTFFKNLFLRYPRHTITEKILDQIELQEVKYPLSYEHYSKDASQNTTETRQLVVKLDLPSEYHAKLDVDPKTRLFFHTVYQSTRSDSHPDCFAWARVSVINENEWLVDEIQSDFMYGNDGIASYRAVPSRIAEVFKQQISAQDFKRINDTIDKLCGNWHQVLLSAVMQAARNNNVKHVHMADTEHMKEKAAISSTNKLNKIYDKLPQDFHFKKKEISIPVRNKDPISKPFWTREARVIKRYLRNKKDRLP